MEYFQSYWLATRGFKKHFCAIDSERRVWNSDPAVAFAKKWRIVGRGK
jgi:hypothetical protein